MDISDRRGAAAGILQLDDEGDYVVVAQPLQRKSTECGNQFLRQPSTLGTSEREIPLTVLAVVKEGAVPPQTCTWEMGLDPGGRTLGRQARPPGRTARTGSGLACSCDVVADGSLLVLG